jgi:hypothetical protein
MVIDVSEASYERYRINLMYQLSGVGKFIKAGYELNFTSVRFTVIQSTEKKIVMVKPASFIKQLRYRNKTELTTNGTKFLNDAMINSAGIYVVNCWAGIDYINREIVIRPVSLLRQLVYFIKFSYLFEPIILDK